MTTFEHLSQSYKIMQQKLIQFKNYAYTLEERINYLENINGIVNEDSNNSDKP